MKARLAVHNRLEALCGGNAARLRLRNRTPGDAAGDIYRDDQTFKRAVKNLCDDKTVAVEVLDREERLSPQDVVVSVRHVRYPDPAEEDADEPDEPGEEDEATGTTAASESPVISAPPSCSSRAAYVVHSSSCCSLERSLRAILVCEIYDKR